jgi:Cytochrome P460
VKTIMLVLLATATLVSLNALYAAESVQYPDNFRRWVHVGTGVVLPGVNPQLKSEEGMHHVFANEKAVEGYSSGDFRDGSIIVYELREAQQKNGVIFEGDRKRVDLMIKDSSFKSTGGWRFERFWGNDRAQNAVPDSGTPCFQCHSKANAHGFVFSQLH